MVDGQWGLIPFFAKTPKVTYQTNNARSEELAAKATFRDPWKRGQRCLIPAVWFDEPNWESGSNVCWSFRRADGQPWALAGLWNTWRDKEAGELFESYTMLTLNADAHRCSDSNGRRTRQQARQEQQGGRYADEADSDGGCGEKRRGRRRRGDDDGRTQHQP